MNRPASGVRVRDAQEHSSIPAALALLREARELALESGREVWEFAVEIGRLRSVGMTNGLLRRLLVGGHVEHRLETTGKRSRRRRFRRCAALALGATSCFVLTDQGECLPAACSPVEKPRWDADGRQLWYRGLLVKQFRGQTGNQDVILDVFEEEGWPVRIDDPLPGKDGMDPKTRVRNTLTRLNRAQRNQLLRFEADGRGGILWSPGEER
jgi:hypothetical protein